MMSRWAISIWVAIVLAVTIRVAIASPYSHTVYPIYTTAAERWTTGGDMYGDLGPGRDIWRYHPVVASWFTPFNWLPEKVGAILWRWLNLAVFLGGLFAFRRHILHNQISFALLALLTFPLCLHSFNNGQANLLLVGLMMFGTVAFSLERWWQAALCIGLATLLKSYPIALAMLLMLYSPRQFGLRFTLLLIVGWCLPFALHSPQYVAWQYERWFENIRLDDRLSAPLSRATVDFYLMCRVWLVEPNRFAYRMLQLVTALMIALACRQCRTHPMRLLFTFDMACLWMALFGPATESCTYTLLAPTLATTWLIAYRERVSGLWLISATLFGWIVCAGALPREWRPTDMALEPIAALFLVPLVMLRVKSLEAVRVENPIGF